MNSVPGVPADATPEQREARLKAFRQGVKKAFVISEITPDADYNRESEVPGRRHAACISAGRA